MMKARKFADKVDQFKSDFNKNTPFTFGMLVSNGKIIRSVGAASLQSSGRPQIMGICDYTKQVTN